MNISNDIGFDGVRDVQTTTDEKLEMLIRRLEAFRLSVVNQLRSQPTVFFADPDADPEAVSGSKAGDVAFWTDNTGTDQFRIL